MIEKAKDYLRKHLIEGDRLLLGLSGGGDSRCLFELLQEGSHEFHAVYIDHGWREESLYEGQLLQVLCEKHDIPFHLEKLTIATDEPDLENRCRQARLEVFAKISKNEGLNVLCLGHHSDDQAETVLKRVLEGAYLTKLSGIKSNVPLAGLKVLRPLLEVSKKEILQYLQQQKIEYFTDPTNFDSKYLRARMRKEILPTLSKQFGKEVSENLVLLGKRSFQLEVYLKKKIEPYLSNIKESEVGLYLPLPEERLEDLEFEFILRELFNRRELDFSAGQIQQILQIYKDGKSNKEVIVCHNRVILDQNRLFVVPKELGWKLEPRKGEAEKIGWEEFFIDGLCVNIDPKQLDVANLNDRIASGKRLKKQYVDDRVPAFLRELIPIIRSPKGLIEEMLSKTGRGKEPANHLLTLIDKNHKIDSL